MMSNNVTIQHHNQFNRFIYITIHVYTNLHKLNFYFLNNIWYLDVQMKNVYKDKENDNIFAFFSKMNFSLICMIKPKEYNNSFESDVIR